MFTGIISALGEIKNLEQIAKEWRLTVAVGKLSLADVKIGDSIAVSGVCLTVVGLDHSTFQADVSRETMRRTSLGSLKKGSPVNLEKALTPDSRLGGHFVSGHVDGLGVLKDMHSDGGSVSMRFIAPDTLARYIAAKGSICIDGTSLTVNEVNGAEFTVNIIPYTQRETVIHVYQVGQEVNLEVDLISRYMERLLLGDAASISSSEKDIPSDNVNAELKQQQG
jgi:riboflavin synthase